MHPDLGSQGGAAGALRSDRNVRMEDIHLAPRSSWVENSLWLTGAIIKLTSRRYPAPLGLLRFSPLTERSISIQKMIQLLLKPPLGYFKKKNLELQWLSTYFHPDLSLSQQKNCRRSSLTEWRNHH